MIAETTLTEAQVEQLAPCNALENASFPQRKAIRSARLSIDSQPDFETDVRYTWEPKGVDALKPEAVP